MDFVSSSCAAVGVAVDVDVLAGVVEGLDGVEVEVGALVVVDVIAGICCFVGVAALSSSSSSESSEPHAISSSVS